MMAAEGGNIIIRFTYTGEENIPREATHIFVDVAVILANAFDRHPHIVEVKCHDRIENIETRAFSFCPSLRRVVMPGVKEVERYAFNNCPALTDVECGKLEIIKHIAFARCKSLKSINLPSARIIEAYAFSRCEALVEVKFSKKLERIDGGTFYNCKSLERITIPLKDGLFTHDNTFQLCEWLKQVDLIERAELQEFISALQLEEWRNDMYEVIDSINQTLPTTNAGYWMISDNNHEDYGEKAQVIRRWIRSVLGKIIVYQAEHQQILNEAASTIRLVLPGDVLL